MYQRSQQHSYYFVGIGGTAMASVAVALKDMGHLVSGSDNGVYPPMSGFLDEHGIRYFDTFSSENILKTLQADHYRTVPCGSIDPERTQFVIGNAVSRGNPEVEEILNRRLPYYSLAGLVGSEFIGRKTSLVITGTHGKTTVTSLAAWVLEAAGLAPGFLVGGIPNNFGVGCRPSEGDKVFVIEGDEYDTAFFDKRSKFVHYRPQLAVINNIEFDHADIFSSLDDIKKSFRQFVNLIPQNGRLFVNGDDANAMEVAAAAHCPVETFGLGADNTWRALEIATAGEATEFLVRRAGSSAQRFRLPMSGNHNVRNALAVIAAARALDVSAGAIRNAFSSFTSIKRRMEVIGEAGGVTVIDDFAHHPTAIRETLAALRDKYPDRRLWAIFEPRSNTTTRSIFQNELAEALSLADLVILGALNRPERYAESERLSPETLIADIRKTGTAAEHLPDYVELTKYVLRQARTGDVLAILSNGKFGGIHKKIIRGLTLRSASEG